MLEHRSALDQIAAAGAGPVIAAPGLSAAAVVDQGLLLLQGDPGDPALHEALGALRAPALPPPQMASRAGDQALLWIAPKQWLLQLPAQQAGQVRAALGASLGAALAAVTDVGDAYFCFDIGGERAPDVLMTGCRLDLHPAAFAAHRVARTALADVPAVLWKREAPLPLRCLVDRSCAAHLWNWLAQCPAPG